RAFTYLRGKLIVLAHGSILSRNEASSKPGVIQSTQFAIRQVFSGSAVKNFQFELERISAALTNKASGTVMLVCRNPTSDHALSNAIFGCEHFVAPFAGLVVLDYPTLEFEIMFSHVHSKVVSNSWGSVQTRGGSVCVHCGESLMFVGSHDEPLNPVLATMAIDLQRVVTAALFHDSFQVVGIPEKVPVSFLPSVLMAGALPSESVECDPDPRLIDEIRSAISYASRSGASGIRRKSEIYVAQSSSYRVWKGDVAKLAEKVIELRFLKLTLPL
ncbi:hypothetical protein, partial [Eoetvoesiella caeni]